MYPSITSVSCDARTYIRTLCVHMGAHSEGRRSDARTASCSLQSSFRERDGKFQIRAGMV